MSKLFCDGGVIGRNPSKIGGTWAWCLVSENHLLRYDCGIILPETVGLPVVTNNVTELYAAVKALTAMGPLWTGTLHTDSYVTLSRLLGRSKFSGVPQWLRVLTLDLKRNGGKARRWNVSLVGGHPTKKELEAGFRKRNGFPVSKWNVWCDERCREEARRYLYSERGNG